MAGAQAAGPLPQPAAAGSMAPPADEARLKALYSVMQSIENKLGGGEGVEGLYGSIKKSGMDRVVDCMRHKCGLDARSVLVDVGAGLGRPLMHALLSPGIAGARGIEIDRIKCDKAHAFLRQAVAELARRGVLSSGEVEPPEIQCSAIEDVRSLDPCTHAYSFWEGVPTDGKAAFGRLFAASRTLQSVAVVQRAIRTCPLAYMADLGFGELELVGSFSVSMSGSGRSFTAYVFNKAQQPAVLPEQLAVEAAAAASVRTPQQAAEAAGASLSEGTVALPAELEGGETAQSRRAGGASAAAAAAVEGAATGRSRRQRKPSARQQAAEEAERARAAAAAVGRQARSTAREQRAERRMPTVWGSAKDVGQGLHVAAAPAVARQRAQQAEQRQDQQQAAAALLPRAQAEAEEDLRDVVGSQTAGSPPGPLPASAPLPSPRLSAGSQSRPAGGAAPAAAAAPKPTAPHRTSKLSSPQKAGVQKRTSPVKPAKPAGAASGGALPPAPRRASPRKLALSGLVAAKAAAAAADPQLPSLVSSTAPLLQHGGRVTKAAMAGGAKAQAQQRETRQSARRGLLGSSGAAH